LGRTFSAVVANFVQLVIFAAAFVLMQVAPGRHSQRVRAFGIIF
jgi:hypothetical protein